MRVKFFRQKRPDRIEWIIIPTFGIIVRDTSRTIAFAWLIWSVSFAFKRGGRVNE
jgi:hypothetical protein